MMIGVIILSFTLLSASFMLLFYRYIISEKRSSMERNAGYIASFTSSYSQLLDIRSDDYKSYVASIALISDSFVIVSTTGGNIVYATDGTYFYSYGDSKVPQTVVDQALSVRQTEQLVKRLQSEKPEQPRSPSPAVNYVAEAERDLSNRLGRACHIAHGKKKGKVEITYYGVDDLNALLDALGRLELGK